MERRKKLAWIIAITAGFQLLPVLFGGLIFIVPFVLWASVAYKCFTDPKYAERIMTMEDLRRQQREERKRREKDDY